MDKKTYDTIMNLADKVETFGKGLPDLARAAVTDADRFAGKLTEFAEKLRIEADKQRGDAVWGDATDSPQSPFKTGDPKVDNLVNDFYQRMVNKNPDSQEWIDRVTQQVEDLFNVKGPHKYETEDPNGGVQ